MTAGDVKRAVARWFDDHRESEWARFTVTIERGRVTLRHEEQRTDELHTLPVPGGELEP